jgi:hypothetical protein
LTVSSHRTSAQRSNVEVTKVVASALNKTRQKLSAMAEPPAKTDLQ